MIIINQRQFYEPGPHNFVPYEFWDSTIRILQSPLPQQEGYTKNLDRCSKNVPKTKTVPLNFDNYSCSFL